MTQFDYNIGIPASGNNPSVDQPKMQVNTNSINSIISEDHVTFNAEDGGFHKHARIKRGTIPSGRIANSGTLWDQEANSYDQLFFSNDTTGNEYQLTRTDNANFSTFKTNGAYGTPPGTFTQTGGWTFLPGGMLFQYGFFGKTGATGTSGTIQFPFTFTSPPYSVSVSLYRTTGNQSITVSKTTPPTTSSFTFLTSSSGSDGVYWTAIGV